MPYFIACANGSILYMYAWQYSKAHIIIHNCNDLNGFNVYDDSLWRHKIETFSALLAICAGNSPVTGEFHAQRPVTRNFDVFFDLRLNKRLSEQWWGRWLETSSHPLWRHSNVKLWHVCKFHIRHTHMRSRLRCQSGKSETKINSIK